MKTLSIVIPCYNNAENISDLYDALQDLSNKLSQYKVEYIFVDDGSIDNTYKLLLQYFTNVQFNTTIVKLIRNFGSYNAFLAGLNYGTGDYYAQVHADIQDHPKHLVEMFELIDEQTNLVIAQRIDREEKGVGMYFAKLYHCFMKTLIKNIPNGGYDLILFDKKIRDIVVNTNPRNTNLVYYISSLNFPFAVFPITRAKRTKGKSQWTLSKKIKLVINSLVAFSSISIQTILIGTILISLITTCLLLGSFFYLSISLYIKVFINLLLLVLLLVFLILAVHSFQIYRIPTNQPNFIVETVIQNK